MALLNGRVVGYVEQNLHGKLRFTYDQAWRDWPSAYPLSLSMPMGRLEHDDAKIRPYLEGLLPDNDWILMRWGTQFHVSHRNPVALLAHMGEDCAGAVQFCRADRVAELQKEAAPSVRWLTDEEIAATLRELRTQNATGRVAADPGYFSLPGAQPKTALLHQDGRWGTPSGRTPTTHILKPPLGDFEGFAENEHLCLRLAAALGLPTARSEVRRFGDEIAIVVERYDRIAQGERIVRVHQEDFCQALSVPSRIKYEAEGGPGAGAMAGVLRDFS
ncbi:MAG TPA: HipA domain-containing protein, partial [Longimicrobium sp.]|nr:HipA domain-containing protein [Longimicrobium sp.]